MNYNDVVVSSFWRYSRDQHWGGFMVERVLDAVLPHDGVVLGPLTARVSPGRAPVSWSCQDSDQLLLAGSVSYENVSEHLPLPSCCDCSCDAVWTVSFSW